MHNSNVHTTKSQLVGCWLLDGCWHCWLLAWLMTVAALLAACRLLAGCLLAGCWLAALEMLTPHLHHLSRV